MNLEESQLLPPLREEEFVALKAAICTHGVLVPVEVDENGQILDGHHRVRAVEELRAEGHAVPDYPTVERKFATPDDRIQHALSLNLARRHLTVDQRRPLVKMLRQRGWSGPRIATALGVSADTVELDLRAVSEASDTAASVRVVGKDGKTYPTIRKRRARGGGQEPSLLSEAPLPATAATVERTTEPPAITPSEHTPMPIRIPASAATPTLETVGAPPIQMGFLDGAVEDCAPLPADPAVLARHLLERPDAPQVLAALVSACSDPPFQPMLQELVWAAWQEQLALELREMAVRLRPAVEAAMRDGMPRSVEQVQQVMQDEISLSPCVSAFGVPRSSPPQQQRFRKLWKQLGEDLQRWAQEAVVDHILADLRAECRVVRQDHGGHPSYVLAVAAAEAKPLQRPLLPEGEPREAMVEPLSNEAPSEQVDPCDIGDHGSCPDCGAPKTSPYVRACDACLARRHGSGVRA